MYIDKDKKDTDGRTLQGYMIQGYKDIYNIFF